MNQQPDHSTRNAWLRALMLRDPGRWSSRLGALVSWLRMLGRGQRRRFGRAAAGVFAGASGIALMALLAGPMAPPVHAATINVDATCSLIDAIKSANTDTSVGTCEAGSGDDTIVLSGDLTYSGYYADYQGPTALPQIESNITINGDAGGGNKFSISRDLSAPYTFRFFNVGYGYDLTLQNVTLSNGHQEGEGGGAIYLETTANLTLINTTLSNNYAGSAGGGAVYARNRNIVVLQDVTFSGNTVNEGYGGGLYSFNATITGTNVTFTDNEVLAEGYLGGALSVNFAKATLTNTVFTNNVAYSGGAIYVSDGSLTLADVTFTGNEAYAYGGVIYSDGSTITIENATFTENTVESYYGGAIYSNGSTITVDNSRFESNYASSGGGAIFAVNGPLTITATQFLTNTTDEKGGGLYIKEIYDSYGVVTMTDVTFSGNTAASGGGAVYSGTSDVTLEGAMFTGNSSYRGGAIYTYGGAFTITDTLFIDNQADLSNGGAGGAIWANEGGVNVISTTFMTNRAENGGAIFSGETELDIVNSTFTTNTAATYGGALYLINNSSPSAASLTHVTITGNSAEGGGGGIYVGDSSGHTITRTIVSGNTSPIGAEIYAQGGDSLASNYSVLGSSAVTNAQAFEDFTPDATDRTATSDGTYPTALAGILTDLDEDRFVHYLVDFSPAVDIVLGTTCETAVDQLGNARPIGGGCDAGAVETDALPAANNDTTVFVSTWAFGSVSTISGTLDYTQLDILAWDGDEWTKWFDGMDAGLNPDAYKPGSRWKHNINAMSISDTESSEVYMSFTQNDEPVPGIPGRVDGMDVVFWDGDEWELVFNGNLRNIGLNNKTQEKIDGLQVLSQAPAGSEFTGEDCEAYMLISTQGPGLVPKPGNIKPKNVLKFGGEDVLGFCATNLGANTTGFWELVVDGSALGVKRNNIESISMSEDSTTMYLTSKNQFRVDSAFGGHSMVYTFDMDTETFDGPVFTIYEAGMAQSARLDALHVTGDPSEWMDQK